MQSSTNYNHDVLEKLCLDTRSQFDSRVWFSPFLRLEASRAMFSIEMLTADGDLEGASTWREALMLDLARDIAFENACTA